MTTKRVSEKNLAMSPGAGKLPSTRKAAPSQRSARSTASVEIPVTGAAIGVDTPHEPISTQPIATQAIAALAYSYWVARGCKGGSSEEDWLRAERELSQSAGGFIYSKATA
jgi:hypothetical protein